MKGRMKSEEIKQFKKLLCSDLNFREIGEILNRSQRSINGQMFLLAKRYNAKTRCGLVTKILTNEILN